MLWRKGLVTKLIRGKDNLIRGAELNKCTHINRPLQLLVPFEVAQKRTLDEKKLLTEQIILLKN